MNKFQKKQFDAAVKARPYLKKLGRKLLSLGGDTVVLWNPDALTEESFVMLLLTFGRVSKGKPAYFHEMSRNSCHDNARALARRHPKRYQVESGYTLSSDKCWRPHSWVWDIKNSLLVETTEPRLLYFGLTMQ